MLRLFRMKSLSVYQLTLSLLIITAVFSVGFIFVGWTYTEIFRVKAKIKELKNTSINKQKDKLKKEVSRLVFYLEYIQQDTAHHTQEQIKDEALIYFENMRFGNDGYVFVNTYDGIALLFDGQKLDEIKNITNLTDPNGFKIFEKELELAKLPEGGSFQYLFKKIYTATPQPKLSYVMGFDQWGWIIGTGDYLDKVENEVSLLEHDLKRDMYRNIFIACSIFILVLFVLVFAAYWFARWIQYQFNKFVLILKQTSLNKNIEQPLDRVFIHELKTIGLEILQAEGIVKQFGDIIDQSLNEIYIFEQNSLKFVHANRGALKNCGYSLDEMQFLTPLDIKPELNLNQFQDLVAPLIEKKTNQIRFETVHQRKNKTLYPVDVHLTHSFFNERPVFVAFIYDISERKKTENQLLLSEQRYSEIFKNAPISLWEEDFTELIVYLDAQIKQYNLPIETLFEKYPEVLVHSASLVKVTDVNSQTLSLFEAQNKEDLFGNLSKLFSEHSLQEFKQSLLALYRGDEQYSTEGENLTLKGKKLDVLLRWSFLSKDKGLARKIIVSIVDLTDFHKTEKELFTANKIINRSPAVAFLWKNEEGWPVEFVAESVEKLTGYTMHEFITGKITYSDIIHKDDIEHVGKEVADNSQKAGKDSFAHEDYRIITKKGEVKWVNDITFIRKDSKGIITHYEGVVYDVTEKHQIEDALRKSEEILKAAQRLAKIGSWELDLVTNKLYWSDEAYRLFNLKPQEFGGTYEAFLDNIHPDDRELVNKAYTDSLKDKTPYDIVHRLLLKDGSIKFLHEHCETFYDEKGKAIRSLGTVQDITDRKLVEDELEKHRNHLEEIVKDRTGELEESQDALLNLVDDLNLQSEKLEKTNARLAEINEELETFTYSVSHDLKAPLRGIDGYSQLLLDECKEDIEGEAREFLENIRKSTLQMSLLIEDLLAYSRMERKNFQSESILFKPIIENLLLVYSEKFEENQVQIKLSFPDEFALVGDKDGLSLVFRNLLDNALKFSSVNKTSQIEIGGSESDNHWHIFVKDNGIGFDMKYHDRIFKIFQRLHLAEEYEGTGIGLAMVSKAMQRMNGKIRAESEAGKGSCFYLEIEKPLSMVSG